MRAWAPAAAAALATGRAKLELLVYMALTPALRLTTAMDSVDWGGHTWLSTRGLSSVEPIKDEGDSVAGIKLSLSGARPDNLSTALAANARGKACTLYIAVFDPATEQILDAQPEAALVLDQLSINDAAPDEHGRITSTISVSARHMGSVFARPKPVLYTDADQQRLHPGDLCLEFINAQASTEVIWPEAEFYRV